MRRWGLLLLAPILAGCQAPKAPPPAAPPPLSVQVEKPQYRDVSRTIELPGDVVPYQQALLYARVPGYLKSVLVDKGDAVREGQLLAVVDAAELGHDVNQAVDTVGAADANVQWGKARLANAAAERDAANADVERTLALEQESRANLQAARADLALARLTWQRLKSVYDSDSGLMARQDLDEAQGRVQDAQARLAASQQALRASQRAVDATRSKATAATSQMDALAAQYQNAAWQGRAAHAAANRNRTLNGYTEIRAPFSGTITERLVDAGALVQSTSAHPLLGIADFNLVRVTVHVPEPAVSFVNRGTPVTIHALALTDAVFHAQVTRTSNALDPTSRTMLAEAWVRNLPHRLKPGMYVKVTLDLETHPHVLALPARSVVSNSVFVADHGRAQKIPVKTGFQSDGWVEITEGLTGKETVIVSPVDAVVPDAPVIVKP